MKNIDFLPDIYRQREALRKARVWWAGVVVIFGAVIGSAGGVQAWLRSRLEAELSELAPHYAAAQAEVQELAALQSQIVLAGHEASLFTYLEHPWPRTQILAHLIAPLPAAIELTQIHLTEQDQARSPTQPAAPRPGRTADTAAARLLPAEQDLRRLRTEVDRRQTLAEVSGTTHDVAELHQYVADLNRSPLVASAQIKLIDAAARDARQTPARFTLRVLIQFGHGQNNGRPLPSAAALRAADATIRLAADPAAAARPAEGGAE